MNLHGKHLVLGLTGGIAAYKACELARRMQDEGATVQAVMTRAAQEFVTATTLQALTGRPVFTDQWGQDGGRVSNAMPHIDLTRIADAIVVAPASAHFIARTAHGLADDLLSTLVLARRCPLLVAPAMNVEMWSNPATQRNVETLRGDGVVFLGPASGEQACGETGAGRMLEPHELLEDVVAFFQPKLLAGKRVLITAGPTFEPIDPVRGITNLSSGKTGFAIARAAREAGAEVTLVAGPTPLATPRGVTRVDVQTAQQMHDAVRVHAAAARVFIAVAAVADWRVKNAATSKLKKSAGAPKLAFEPNPDILAAVAKMKRGPFCVGFAAETDDVERHGQAKRKAKNVPLLVANRAQDAFGADDSELLLIDAEGTHTLPRASKLAQARRLMAEIARRIGRSDT
ncbi:MAG: bifunctional phosphopantothenoylcysteine decarboxylase/phosphopantothenate--cysteine ligase CoaBC [Burkholderiaceae bacterium]|jgi:phosphopantothenoylcysteine decarboxylase/phosphopantothenate--cysteine ligase|nr:bifunctional phosphopantothenoylcysteine decarboxylase/phosphopantothenate--cysteine ligase CoaBC [Burkholderiaceae bacterium]